MGVSHLLEHMVFKGTRRRDARAIALALETLGGSLDAFTSREHTSYQARVLDEHLFEAADVIGDLIFHPLLRATDLALERKVVLEEISMVEDTPDDLVFELHNELFWGDHPYGYSILGTRETVSSLSADDVRALQSRAHQPQELVLTVAGNVEHDHLLEVLTRTEWGAIPRGSDSAPRSPPPCATDPAVRHVPREAAQTHVVFGAPCMNHRDPRRYTLALVSTLFGGGMSSRLFQRVREELALAYSIYTHTTFHFDSGVQGVYVATAPDTAAEATATIRAELARLAAESLGAEELAMGRQQLKGQVTLSHESVSSRMFRMATAELYGEPHRSLDDVLARIDAIDEVAVAEVCHEFFEPDRYTILSLGPAPAVP